MKRSSFGYLGSETGYWELIVYCPSVTQIQLITADTRQRTRRSADFRRKIRERTNIIPCKELSSLPPAINFDSSFIP
jgi:hypothetical protein